jgi:hypothetical protein
VTSTALTLIIVPILYRWFEPSDITREEVDDGVGNEVSVSVSH